MRLERKAREWFVSGERLGSETMPAIDFQMHTLWTDGRSSVAEMMAAAHDKGLQAIAITEHVNASSVWYPDFVAEVKLERLRVPELIVYAGAEIAAADYRGGLKFDPARIESELLLGVVHRLPKQEGGGFWSFDDLKKDDAIELEIRALTGLARNRSVDVIGHPGGTAFKKFGAFPVDWLEPVFVAARESHIAVELNTKYMWDMEGMLSLLHRIGPMVSFGSDAHQASDAGSNVKFMGRHFTAAQVDCASMAS